MKYQVIVCDPPWAFGDGLKKMKRPVKRSAASQYKVMSVTDIKAIPVKELIDPRGCVLALWVPGTMLQDGLDVMKAWGFVQKQTFVWVKTKKDALKKETDMNKMTRVGMGRLFRQSHEIVLVGTAGKSIYNFLQDKGQRSVAFDLNQGHSTKPETLQDRLDLMFPNADKLEMFGRRTRTGWDVVGDAIDGLDINVAINGLRLLGTVDTDVV